MPLRKKNKEVLYLFDEEVLSGIFIKYTDKGNQYNTYSIDGSDNLSGVDYNDYILAQAPISGLVVFLPDAVLGRGKEVNVTKTDNTAHYVICSGIGGQTIDGDSQFNITSQYENITYISDGTNFWIK